MNRKLNRLTNSIRIHLFLTLLLLWLSLHSLLKGLSCLTCFHFFFLLSSSSFFPQYSIYTIHPHFPTYPLLPPHSFPPFLQSLFKLLSFHTHYRRHGGGRGGPWGGGGGGGWSGKGKQASTASRDTGNTARKPHNNFYFLFHLFLFLFASPFLCLGHMFGRDPA